jgi:hypothetical protein
MKRPSRFAAAAIAAATAAVLLTAAPASADPARPSDFRSRIDAIEPATEAFEADILGGDSFIELAVEPGHEVVVLGYGLDDPEPYLRFLADGTVQENLRSEATYLNADRYGRPGEVDVPAGLSPDDEPEWRTVATNGRHAWHDHRVHWMSPDTPPGFSAGDVIQTQDVQLLVDGEPVVITVSVLFEDPVSPVPWIVLAVVVLGALVAAGWRRAALPIAVVAGTVAAVAATVVGWGEASAVPAGAGSSNLQVIVPAVALVAAIAAALFLWRGARGLAGVSLLGTAAALAGWALLRLTVLLKPVLPTELPANLDRAGTAAAIGVAAAVVVLAFHSGAIAPALPPEDEPAEP